MDDSEETIDVIGVEGEREVCDDVERVRDPIGTGENTNGEIDKENDWLKSDSTEQMRHMSKTGTLHNDVSIIRHTPCWLKYVVLKIFGKKLTNNTDMSNYYLSI